MYKKIALSFATFALAVASAASQKVTLFQPATVAGQQMKAGEYRLEVNGSTATLSSNSNKTKVEAPVKIESAANKFGSTTVRYENADGKLKVQEIRIGGTNTKLVFGDTTAALR